jgi:hypothetical protein
MCLGLEGVRRRGVGCGRRLVRREVGVDVSEGFWLWCFMGFLVSLVLNANFVAVVTPPLNRCSFLLRDDAIQRTGFSCLFHRTVGIIGVVC